jgi:hypothetical protein
MESLGRRDDRVSSTSPLSLIQLMDVDYPEGSPMGRTVEGWVKDFSQSSPTQEGSRESIVRRSMMLNTVRAIIREGRIELLENIQVPEGAELLVTILQA